MKHSDYNPFLLYRTFYPVVFVVLLCLSLLSSACSSHLKDATELRADSLNHLAYYYRYRNIDSSLLFANQAYALSQNYPSQKAEALNHKAYVLYQQMDFNASLELLKTIPEITDNQIELLIADIFIMKICQRTSQNHLFYTYRNSAQKRMDRINEERKQLTKRELLRLLFAESEFHIVSSTYYYYVKQIPQSLTEINSLPSKFLLQEDSAQLAYYYYMKGSGDLCEGSSKEEITLREFDLLLECFTISSVKNMHYFIANSLQSFAAMFSNEKTRLLIKEKRRAAYIYLYNKHTDWAFRLDSIQKKSLFITSLTEDSLAWYSGDTSLFYKKNTSVGLAEKDIHLAMAYHAVSEFSIYQDLFQTAGAYRTLATCYMSIGKYDVAVKYLNKALNCVNLHYLRYYSQHKSKLLESFRKNDSTSVEMNWLLSKDIYTIPEWIASIREQMSMAYSGLNDKQKSDYNRNIYLDILEVTRQDKELEIRYEQLEKDSRASSLLLFLVILLLIFVVITFVFWGFKWHKKNRQQKIILKHVLELCKITPLKEEKTPYPFTSKTSDWETSEETALIELLQPYQEWMKRNQSLSQELDEEVQQLVDKKSVSEIHIVENKRKNAEKRAKITLVYGILPYLDRIINEVRRLECSREKIQTRLGYVDELADKINEYNDILAQWIKLQQGELNLHIENFQVQSLFDILKKGEHGFELKGLKLEVKQTDAVVKADKVLTLFMINTLADNARKFTPSGGTVSLKATQETDFIEISVEDNGCGLLSSEIELILSSNVYDAKQIGDKTDAILKKKGYGFGLMNCKGIIEKYRKTNTIFQVCLFGIESKKEVGSRFFFRLPKGIIRTLKSLLVLFSLGMLVACSPKAPSKQPRKTIQLVPSQKALNHPDMIRSNAYADSIYFCNVAGEHEKALLFSDSAIYYLNRYYRDIKPDGKSLLRSEGSSLLSLPSEVLWRREELDIDYYMILGIRNETAVAALALHKWSLYQYNNDVYTRLYKQHSQDASLADYCKEMQESQTNKNVSITLLLLVLIISSLLYYQLYIKRSIIFRYNLRQVLHINRDLFSCIVHRDQVTDTQTLLHEMLKRAITGINEIHTVMGMSLVLYDEKQQIIGRMQVGELSVTPEQEAEQLTLCYRSAKISTLSTTQGNEYLYPLLVEIQEGSPNCIGAVVWRTGDESATETDRMFDEMVVRYMAMMLFENILRHQQEFLELEHAEDERYRAQYEEEQFYIQNQVLDNCLSTIKHESMYYPNRIKQMVATICKNVFLQNMESKITSMRELVDYYREIYVLLCSQAERQMSNISFKRKRINSEVLLSGGCFCFEKLCKKRNLPYRLHIENSCKKSSIIGDSDLLIYLFECIFAVMLQKSNGASPVVTFTLACSDREAFLCFEITDPREIYTQEQLDELFSPSIEHIPYLICKQIIRDHDALTNHCGCRINGEKKLEGGYSIWFTIPKSKK